MNKKEDERYDRSISADSRDSLWIISERVVGASKVLDIGIGSGALGDYLTSKKNCQVDGVEKIPAFANIAKPFYRRLYNADIETAKLTDIIVDDKYDYIVLADVLEHLREPGETFKQIPQLMTQGGHLLLSVPNIGHAGVIAGLLSGQFNYRKDGLLDSTHVRFFTRASLYELLESHGFEVLSITPLQKDILETEFKEYFLDTYAPALVRTLLAQADALTYQFIVDAVYNPDAVGVGKRSASAIAITDNQLSFGCQLFWNMPDENYSSAQCISASGVIGKGRQSICFNFPDIDIAPSKLRLDLSDRPGLINIFSMRLIAANGEVLWEWNGDMAYLASLKSADIIFFPSNFKHSLLLTGDDNQLELEIPGVAMCQLNVGASFVVELDWPMNADFAVALAWLSEGGQLPLNLKEDNASLKEDNASLNEEIKEYSANLAEANEDNASLNEEIKEYSSNLAEANIAIATLERIRAEILTSSSWRLTKPWRFLGASIRRLYGAGWVVLVRLRGRKNTEAREEIPDGVIGNLELATVEIRPQLNSVSISGWLLVLNTTIVKVYATVSGFSEQPLIYGYERPDIHEAYLNESTSLKSGFYGIVNWENQLESPIKLEIWAETQSGEKIRCFSRALICRRAPPKKQNSSFVHGYLVFSLRKAWRAFREGRLRLSPMSWWGTLRRDYLWMSVEARDPVKFQIGGTPALILEPYEQWMQTNRITPHLEVLMKSDAHYVETHGGAKISIVVPVYNTPLRFLEEMIGSVTTQFYENWELILVDDASPQLHIREVLSKLPEKDHRIRVVFRTANGHISEATNDGIKEASGDFIALVDHDDTLPPDALLHIAECIAQHPDVDWIYTDEDKIDASGRRYDPQFKAGWSPEMAITHNYTHHLTVIRKLLVDKVGGMRKGFEGAQDLDIFLRVAEITTLDKIRHIPQIGYHWRSHEESTASQGTQKTYVFDSADRAIREALTRRGLSAEPFLPQIAQKYGMCLNQLRWIDSMGPGKEVTIVIPTKDRVDLLKRCISSLYKTCDKRFVKILIMDDRSTDSATLNYFQELENNSAITCRIVSPKRGDGTFNYARLINEAVDYVDTPYILQLNNDVEAIEPGWLEDLMGWLSVDGVGVVGAKLLYPNNTIQHAGVVIGPHGGLADHQFHQLSEKDVGYLALEHAARNVSAVTGACMLTSAELFRKLNGFDEINFAVEFNDVDFCLRAIESGKRVVYTPQATLIHLTSASRGKSFNPQEHINFVKKYKQYKDDFYSRNIRQDSMWMPVDGAHFAHADRVKNIRILLISHALSLTGGPIAAYECARYFATEMGFEVTVLALQDGPVHQMYDELGIPVIVTHELGDIHLLHTIKLQAALQKINNLIHVGEKFDLVVCNTLTTFWGVMLANQSKIPAIWHIHESIGDGRYASTFLDAAIGNMVALAFLKANRVVFQANATRAIYGEFETIENLNTIPGGLPLQRIEKFRLANSKSTLRKKYGIPDDAYVVILVGTTCIRKGQAVFLDAINQMSIDSIPANVSFLMVGAIDGHYLESLREKITRLNLKNVQLVAETKDIYDYYALSDIFVCASFEESFPMVVLLAMAFELPIVSTDVFGIPEIVSDQQEALLFPSGDPQSMAAAILQCINDPDETNAMAARAYAKVNRLFDNEILLARHADLARKVTTEDARAA